MLKAIVPLKIQKELKPEDSVYNFQRLRVAAEEVREEVNRRIAAAVEQAASLTEVSDRATDLETTVATHTSEIAALDLRIDSLEAITGRRTALVSPKYGSVITTSSLGTNNARATFVGYAHRAITDAESFRVRWGVTVSGSGFTWGELAIARGAINFGGNSTIYPVGYLSVSGSMAAAAADYTSTVPMSSGQAIAQGDGIWIVWAKASTGSPTLRAHATDALSAGYSGIITTASWRPSLQLGSASTVTKDTSTALMIAGTAYI